MKRQDIQERKGKDETGQDSNRQDIQDRTWHERTGQERKKNGIEQGRKGKE